MKRFVKFDMDEFPTVQVQMWEGTTENEIADKCYEYAEWLSEAYSGGPTVFKGIMNEPEARYWLFNTISDEIERFHDDQSTVEIIRKMCEQFQETYNNEKA